ncbi:hypothetical protein [Psychrobacter sp. DAB_AL62B]|uniref:hypothetical protein n=1 Tax=Psychrobacter sp. DAB_AL62B TaxID=1028420 RepID=UPI0023816B86|nr:hypothetical protein [Psychrobacter sp. DAB_AL62B]MDE4454000.1 hypothetical protein [Psychrobacter sp. DAB_AL62B]
MLNIKNLSFVLLSAGFLSISLGSTHASAATDVTQLFSVYEEACGYVDSAKSNNAAKTYNTFKNSFIAHKESTTKGIYNDTIFSLKKHYVIPAPYKNTIVSITMKKGDTYSSDSVTYTVKFKDATYRKKPISHLEIYVVPNSDVFYDALYLKTSTQGLKPHFKYVQFDDEKLGAHLDSAKKLILCDGIVGSYK